MIGWLDEANNLKASVIYRDGRFETLAEVILELIS